MTARDVEQLAAELGRPPSSLSAFRDLTPEQIALLSDAIGRARARRERLLDGGLAPALPALPRRLLAALLRSRRFVSRLAVRAELDKLGRTLELEPAELEFLDGVPAEQLRALRIAIYERLYTIDRPAFQRLGSLVARLPVRIALWLALRCRPEFVARIAAELPSGAGVALVSRVPTRFLADMCENLDPRRSRDILRQIPADVFAPVARELIDRGDHMTISRFVDFVPDATLVAVEREVVDEAALLRIAFYMGSKNRLDHLLRTLPPERLAAMLRRVQADSHELLPAFLSLLIHVSYSLKRELGDLAAAQDEPVLDGFIRAAHELELWPDLLPAVASMSPAARSRVVNLPVLAEPAVQEGIIRAADERGLWGIVLPLIAQQGDDNREAVAAILAARGRPTLERAAYAALMGELWEPLLDLARRMPAGPQARAGGDRARLRRRRPGAGGAGRAAGRGARSAGAEVSEHRQHAAVVLGRRRQVELGEDRGDVLLDRPLGDDQLRGDGGVGAALGHQPQHLALARGQRLQRVGAAAAAEQQRHDLGIQRRAAVGDAADGVEEGADVRHAVLEQVADGGRGLAQQVERRCLVDVGGEDEHRGRRVLAADRVGGAQPLVGVAWRHPHVDDRDVGLVGADLAQQVLRIACLADDVDAVLLLQQPSEALTQQHRVICNHYAHGISASSVVPPPGGDSIESLPSSAARRSESPISPVPRAGSAPPTPSSDTSIVAWPLLRATRINRLLRVGVLDDVGQRLGDDVVGGRLDRRRQPLGGRAGDAHRDRRALGQCRQRGLQPLLGQHRGVDAARQLAQLLQRRLQLGLGAVEQRTGALGILLHPRLRQPQLQRQRHEALLSAVVEVALQPPALGDADIDEPRPRALQLGHAGAQLGLQAQVLHRQRGCGADAGDQLALLGLERRVVDDGADRAALQRHLGPRAQRVLRPGQLDAAPVGVGVVAVERVATVIVSRTLGIVPATGSQ